MQTAFTRRPTKTEILNHIHTKEKLKRKVVPRHCAGEKYDGGHPPRRSTLPTTVT
jgi:hypothetical protein